MGLIENAVNASNLYENCNTDLKKKYLIKYINLYKEIVSEIPGYKGSFGTGYPFYALGENYEGRLPVIEEQLRYNNELLHQLRYLSDQPYMLFKYPYSNEAIWKCEECLHNNINKMSNLKIICKRCPDVPKDIKPRKVINRLPDLDLWMIVEKGYEDAVSSTLSKKLEKCGITPSDVDPIKTINDVYEIANDLYMNYMPKKYIPIDTHIISYDEIFNLITNLNKEFDNAVNEKRIPYLPILPLSLRKTWQHDDEAYNFVHDYLYALTMFDTDSNLNNLLNHSRKELAYKYNNNELLLAAIYTGNEAVERRQQNPELIKRFYERINLWRKL